MTDTQPDITKGKAKGLAILTLVLMVVAWVIIAACAIDTVTLSDGGDSKIMQVKVVINYDGSWIASLGGADSAIYKGTGLASYNIQRDSDSMHAGAAVQKVDEGFGILTVSIETLDGHVLTGDSTRAPYGEVLVAWIDP